MSTAPAWLDRFYPIVDSTAWLEPLIAAGTRLVQLRIKRDSNGDGSSDEIRAAVCAARDICARAKVQLVVNDHWQIAMEAGCDFVHLGQGDLDHADLPALRRAGIRVGMSTHDHDELRRALALEPDYIALGPIYATKIKQMPWSPQGLARISEWRQLIGSIPLIAIGGLTVERLPGVFAAGADSAAVITDIVQSVEPSARIGTEPSARIREWVAATRPAT